MSDYRAVQRLCVSGLVGSRIMFPLGQGFAVWTAHLVWWCSLPVPMLPSFVCVVWTCVDQRAQKPGVVNAASDPDAASPGAKSMVGCMGMACLRSMTGILRTTGVRVTAVVLASVLV